MVTSSWSWNWKIGLASWLAVAGAIASGNSALAQIVPDTTLGSENSTIRSTGLVDSIDGGATRGANLFHSFQEFNVSEGHSAFFSNPLGIENILGRVTGSNPSNILGTLGVSGGNANLFLINPNGIIFGPNARLDVKGSFVGTTANAIGLANGETFSANPAQSLPTGLLKVNPNAFFFNQIAAQPIVNRSRANSTGLQVPQNQSLLLVGGDMRLEGGRLRVAGGRVELGGVAGTGTVGLSVNGSDLRLSFPEGVQRANVSLINGAEVNVRAPRGGSIAINVQNLNLVEKSTLQAGMNSSQGSINSQPGNIEISATGAINLTSESRIENIVQEGAVGNAGNINITTGSLSATQGAQVSTIASGVQGNAGNVTINARDTVSFDQGKVFTRLEKGVGKAGNINIMTGSFSATNNGVLIASTRGQGNAGSVTINARDTVSFDGFDSKNPNNTSGAFSIVRENAVGEGGNITITTGSLFVTNRAELNTSTHGQGNAGSVIINARDTVAFDRNGEALSPVERNAVGNGGNIKIATSSLFVTNGAKLSTTTYGRGNAGRVIINARDRVSLDGVSSNGKPYPTGVFSRVEDKAVGNGGNINIMTGSLSVTNGALVSTRTEAQGDGGNIIVNARSLEAFNGGQIVTNSLSSRNAGSIILDVSDSVTLAGIDNTYDARSKLDENDGFVSGVGPSSGLFANTTKTSRGRGGNLRITTGQLTVKDRAEVSVSSELGQAGNLEIKADSILLNQGKLTAVTGAGDGGNITLQNLDLLLMRDRSLISAEALDTANGGNINIDSDFIVAVPSEDSDIIAKAFRGNGGRIGITTSGIFGLEYRDRQTATSSDITASSELGVDGIVEIDTPDIAPSQGLIELPLQLSETQVVQACQPGGSQAENEFVITGGGGLPTDPTKVLSSDAIQVDWVSLEPGAENPSSPAVSTNPTSTAPTPIVEAQGWIVDDNGEVVLTASAPTVTPHSSWLTPAKCRAPQSAPSL